MNLQNYRLIYKNRVYRCLEMTGLPLRPYDNFDDYGIRKADGICEILVLNEDGEMMYIRDDVSMMTLIKGEIGNVHGV